MAQTLETSRLVLERFDYEHLELLADLASIPEVMRFIGSGSTWTRADAEQIAAGLVEHWSEHGFGWRAARLKATSDLVGIMCSNFAAEWTIGLAADEHEIGWWMEPGYQARGLASEGATAVRDEALDLLGAPSVVACIHPGNLPSVAVAKTVGLAYDFSTVGATDQPVDVYRLRSPGPP